MRKYEAAQMRHANAAVTIKRVQQRRRLGDNDDVNIDGGVCDTVDGNTTGGGVVKSMIRGICSIVYGTTTVSHSNR